jgi:hypothetical protein
MVLEFSRFLFNGERRRGMRGDFLEFLELFFNEKRWYGIM